MPPLFNMNGTMPVLNITDITSLTNLPPSGDWFTAALIAAVHSNTANWINTGNAIRQINYTAAAYSLFTPDSPEQTQIVVDYRELPVKPPAGVPWWAAGYLEAMRKHGPFNYGFDGPKWVGAYENGTWSLGLGMYGFKFLRLGEGFVYRTNDTAQMQKIAKIAEKVPVTVSTVKGLATNSQGFQGNLSVGMTEYAVLGLKADGAILMKGRANRLETDGMIPSTEDLAHNVALFSSSYDISAQIK